jgi:hypothetical protein
MGGPTPGNFGRTPAGAGRGGNADESFGASPGAPETPSPFGFEDEPTRSNDPFPGGEEDPFGDVPGGRRSYRLQPNPIDLTGPPMADEVDGAVAEPPSGDHAAPSGDLPARLGDEDAAPSQEDADDILAAPADTSAPLWDAESEGEAEEDVPASSDDAAAAAPRLIAADLLRDGLRRSRVPHRVGRTRIARFRHRPATWTPGGPTDVQVATK